MTDNPFKEIAQKMGPDASNLVAQLTFASMSATADVTQQLLETYQQQIKELEAELWLIRETITDLVTGPYMPTPSRILAALRSSRQEIQDVIANRFPGGE